VVPEGVRVTVVDVGTTMIAEGAGARAQADRRRQSETAAEIHNG
jgi:hypothetical protein